MNNVEIPEFIVLSQDKETFKERYDHARSGIANAYEQLKSITDIAEVIPADIKEVKAELVNTYIDARIAEIAGMKMLTSEARNGQKVSGKIFVRMHSLTLESFSVSSQTIPQQSLYVLERNLCVSTLMKSCLTHASEEYPKRTL